MELFHPTYHLVFSTCPPCRWFQWSNLTCFFQSPPSPNPEMLPTYKRNWQNFLGRPEQAGFRKPWNPPKKNCPNICFLLFFKSKSHKIHPEHVDVNMLSVIGFYSYIFIHRTGKINQLICHKHQLNVGRYTRPMDPMVCGRKFQVYPPFMDAPGLHPHLRNQWTREPEMENGPGWSRCISY